MAQILSDVKEAWRRASYADYAGNGEGTQEISNKLATRTRIFVQELSYVK